jgi:L-cystine transport system permease protein
VVNVGVMLQDLWSILGIVPKTLAMMLLIFSLAVLIGSLFAMIEHKRVVVLREIVTAYRVVFKGPPLIIVVFLAYFAFPPVLQFLASFVGVKFDAYWTPNWVTLVVALTLYYAAFEAEIIKGALNSFDRGQADAAASLGYTDRQMFRRIMFPQVVVTAMPDLTTSTLVIMKGLSLGFAIEVVGNICAGTTGRRVELLLPGGVSGGHSNLYGDCLYYHQNFGQSGGDAEVEELI